MGRILAVVLSAALAVGLTAVARADDPAPGVPSDPLSGPATSLDPCPTVNQNGGAGACDTEYTPQAKPSDQWKRVAGARFGDHKVPADSATPITVDLYSVAFRNSKNGLAGGAACKDESTVFDDLKSCERVPVIWQYSDKDGEGPLWQEVYRGDTKGYVGAVAYYGAGKAMAVGGSGLYPYREFSRDTTSDPDHDPSGSGRVWETNPDSYGDSDWHEYEQSQLPTAPNIPADVGPNVENATATAAPIAEQAAHAVLPGTDLGPASDQLPKPHPVEKPMRALSALDCKTDSFNGSRCVAGGIQQLFMWRDGHFEKSYGNGSRDGSHALDPAPETAEMAQAEDFRFRVRQLRFVGGERPYITILGVTSGCCDASPVNNNIARMLIYDDARWYVRPVDETTARRAPQSLGDSYYAVNAYNSGTIYGSILTTPGGPERSVEPPSRIVGGVTFTEPKLGENPILDEANAFGLICEVNPCGAFPAPRYSHIPSDVHHLDLSDTRLVAADGDTAGPPSATGAGLLGSSGPDRFMDWAVGERRTTRQALAYTTTTTPDEIHAPRPVNCPNATPDQNCQPASQEEIKARASSHNIFLLDTYALNAFTALGASGEGWAVGEKGAIEHLGGGDTQGKLGDEPPPPKLGGKGSSPDPGTAAYRQPTALSSHPGALPSLESASDTVGMPRLVPAGSPDLVRDGALVKPDDGAAIVASRDGGEAWALGSGDEVSVSNTAGQGSTLNGRMTLWHYDGRSWAPCDPEGVPDQLEPDPACASLAPLGHYTRPNGVGGVLFEPVRIRAAARVPLENDADPSNDNEFEVVAVATEYRPQGSKEPPRDAILLYKDGRWSLDTKAMAQLQPAGSAGGVPEPFDIAFTAPDDGWMLLGSVAESAQQTTHSASLYHFDGRRWFSCSSAPAACGDNPTAQRLPTGSVLQLAVADRRVYLYGARVPSASGSASNRYPLILYKDPDGHWTDGSDGSGGGTDPGCPAPGACAADSNTPPGQVFALSVVRDGDGHYDGWATAGSPQPQGSSVEPLASVADMRHLERDPSSGRYEWRTWTAPDATKDYAESLRQREWLKPKLMTFAGSGGGPGPALFLPIGEQALAPILRFDPAKHRWAPLQTPFVSSKYSVNPGNSRDDTGAPRAITPDGQGGAWIEIHRTNCCDGSNVTNGAEETPPTLVGDTTSFYHYTTQIPRQVLSDVPNPVGSKLIVGGAAGGDGSYWLATDSNSVYRYDRAAGWDRVDVPGWDPGRVVTRPSRATAIAIGQDGNGILVGDHGRVADLSPQGVKLDPAAGTSCARGGAIPCGTGRRLQAAAVAPDGSALVGGEARTVLWRP
ncbi:MAG: hypothetical protein QOJ38_1479, partial [Solirubrobacterales bacterium]|nr:hypothetical protein [Solirubrobacterales bacterium]